MKRNADQNQTSWVMGLFIIGGMLIFALIGYGYGVQNINAEYADRQSKITHENTENHINNHCINMSGSAFSTCVHEAIKTSGEYQRAEKDLAAQSRMAKWAFALLVFTAFSLLVTVIGVVYVRDTLLETRRIGRAETRAYLVCRSLEISCDGTGENASLNMAFRIENLGNSPASFIKISGHYGKLVSIEPFDNPQLSFGIDNHDIIGPKSFGMLIYSIAVTNLSEENETAFQKIAGDIRFVWINGTLKWLDVFGDNLDIEVSFTPKDFASATPDTVEMATYHKKYEPM